MTHAFPYKWEIKDGYPAKGIEKNNLNVFSCFACGGGSTMGYKLAGYNVLGCNEIDPKMMEVYKINHNPEYSYLESIQDFKERNDFPDSLYNLDILDGSPPCSSFSMSGSREKTWGVKTKFKEGQINQILDDLFFHLIDLAKKLRPKVIIAENVKGMLWGNARSYVKRIIKQFRDIGYSVQLFLLNSATMGVPQKRERVFFIANRMKWNKLEMRFNEKLILFKEVENNISNSIGKEISKGYYKWWINALSGKSLSSVHPKGSYFNSCRISKNKVLPTIIADGGAVLIHYNKPNKISDSALCLCGSYPLDYNFLECKVKYLIGMSVPPVMMAQIAHQVYLQWFK